MMPVQPRIQVVIPILIVTQGNLESITHAFFSHTGIADGKVREIRLSIKAIVESRT
jgi:hypothetical protein